MDDIDDLKDFGLAVLSLLVASVEAQESHAIDPAVAEISALAATLPPCSLFRSWESDSTPPAAALSLDNSFSTDSGAFEVDGGSVTATASSSKSALYSASKVLSRTGGHWQSIIDARSSWLQLQLERPTYLLFAELEWKWGPPVRLYRSQPRTSFYPYPSLQLRGIPQAYTVSSSTDGKTWSTVREV